MDLEESGYESYFKGANQIIQLQWQGMLGQEKQT